MRFNYINYTFYAALSMKFILLYHIGYCNRKLKHFYSQSSSDLIVRHHIQHQNEKPKGCVEEDKTNSTLRQLKTIGLS